MWQYDILPMMLGFCMGKKNFDFSIYFDFLLFCLGREFFDKKCCPRPSIFKYARISYFSVQPVHVF